jgi:hypothetical protein
MKPYSHPCVNKISNKEPQNVEVRHAAIIIKKRLPLSATFFELKAATPRLIKFHLEILFAQLEQRGSAHTPADAHGFHAIANTFFPHIGQEGCT